MATITEQSNYKLNTFKYISYMGRSSRVEEGAECLIICYEVVKHGTHYSLIYYSEVLLPLCLLLF